MRAPTQFSGERIVEGLRCTENGQARSAGNSVCLIFISVAAQSWEDFMNIWTILFAVLLIAWIGGFTVFHVAGGLINLLLVFAVISLILHFVLGKRTA